jgi:hypothetical protein
LPTVLRCDDNNKAETLLNSFETAVEKFGLTNRVCSDKGLENVNIADYMLPMRGAKRERNFSLKKSIGSWSCGKVLGLTIGCAPLEAHHLGFGCRDKCMIQLA